MTGFGGLIDDGLHALQPAALMSMVQNVLAPLEVYGEVEIVPTSDGGIVARWQSRCFPNALDVRGNRQDGFLVEVVWEMAQEKANDTKARDDAVLLLGRLGTPIIQSTHRHISKAGIDYHYHFYLKNKVNALRLKQVLNYIASKMPAM